MKKIYSALNSVFRKTLDVYNMLFGRIFFKNNNLGLLKNPTNRHVSKADNIWLTKNKEERMDAMVSSFDEKRRDFHLARYAFASKFVSKNTVADIACGTGYGSELIANAGATKVFAVDCDSSAIKYARKYHNATNIDYKFSDACDTGIDSNSCDVVVSFETIEHIKDDIGLVAEVFRILKKDGLFICSTPNKWPLELATHHVKEYDKKSFVDLLSRYFSVQSLYNQNSGSETPLNNHQPAGIVPTLDSNEDLAECFIAVCVKSV